MAWNEQVAKRDYMPIEERRALQLERLQATVHRVYEHVPFYRKALNDQDIEPTGGKKPGRSHSTSLHHTA